jgi:hypothetical protein
MKSINHNGHKGSTKDTKKIVLRLGEVFRLRREINVV